MALLEHRAHVDDAVDVRTRRREAADRRIGRTRARKSAQLAQPLAASASAKAYSRQAPSARAAWPSCIGLASARRTTGAEWKRMPIVKPLARCLVGRLGR